MTLPTSLGSPLASVTGHGSMWLVQASTFVLVSRCVLMCEETQLPAEPTARRTGHVPCPRGSRRKPPPVGPLTAGRAYGQWIAGHKDNCC